MYNTQLETFLTVADLGSFNKAAEALYISVRLPSQSRSICWKAAWDFSFLSGRTGDLL